MSAPRTWNMASKASLTRTMVPELSTIITPSTSESMICEWRRSASSMYRASFFRSVMSRTLTTMPPISSAMWFDATISTSIQSPSGPTARSSIEAVTLR